VHEFEHIARTRIPRVVARAGLGAFAAVCDSLEVAVRQTKPSDPACSFRAAIEVNDRGGDERSALIDAVRDAAEQLGREKPEVLVDILTQLERREDEVFTRLTLNFVRIFAERLPDALRRYMLEPATLDSSPLWHERRLLERDGFRFLPAEDRTAYLAMIDRGPDVEAYRREREPYSGPLAEGDVSRFVGRWKRDHLALIEEVLPEEQQMQYRSLVKELGPSEHPEFQVWGGTGHAWMGPVAPSSAQEIEKLTIDELFAILDGWKPQPRFDGPFASRDGLARELSKVIGKSPEPYATASLRFIGQRPAYVRAVLEGLWHAVKAKQEFAWGPVLELSQWVLTQPFEDTMSVDEAISSGEDPGWRWTRLAIARLLAAAPSQGSTAVPMTWSDEVFNILRSLLNENQEPSTMQDPLDQALNTITGVATEALIRWAIRRRQCVQQEHWLLPTDASELIETLLKAHSSLAPRAMLGMYLPELVALDAAWVGAHQPVLFPLDAPAERAAVWQTYLKRREPTLLSFRQLANEYQRDVENLSAVATVKDHIDGLVHHLVLVYWSGHISLDEGLLSTFYANADTHARIEVVRYMGASFFHTKGSLSEVIERQARILWERRLGHASAHPSSETADEVSEFGWWFASAKFDLDWSMEQLHAVLELCDHVELDHAVTERLGEVARTRPVQSLRLLSKMMSRASDWSVIGCRHGIEAVVRAGLASHEPDAPPLARELVSRLAAKGHDRFVDLLK
jgi:hypothetical protein